MAQTMTYKGHPVVRDANRVYYGEPYNKYIVVLIILEGAGEGQLPSRVLVQLQSTDPALAMSKEKIIKESERKNLFDALEIGSLWLDKVLTEDTK